MHGIAFNIHANEDKRVCYTSIIYILMTLYENILIAVKH